MCRTALLHNKQTKHSQFQSYRWTETSTIAVQEQCGEQRNNRGEQWDINWQAVYCARCAAETSIFFQNNKAFSVAKCGLLYWCILCKYTE